MVIKRGTLQADSGTNDGTIGVGELTARIKNSLEDLGEIQVRGEISQWKVATSGHTYFTLKDESAIISAVLWRGRTQRYPIRDGMNVVARGSLTVYPPRGSYQLDCTIITPLGQGDLQMAFEQLKQKLLAEGLFDAARKRPLPQLPRKIGIVTSRTGAAVHDILTTLKRLAPSVQVVIRPALVQGAGASTDIAEGIAELNSLSDVDLLIVGRGGGSIEDLWAFNEEELARAIASSRVPIISAVGHETDFTIADFVADLRAPTPTAAAQIAVSGYEELMNIIYQYALRISGQTEALWEDRRRMLERAISSRGMSRPMDLIRTAQQRIDDLEHRTHLAARTSVRSTHDRVSVLEATLKALNPMNVLKRGFAVIEKQGTPVKSIEGLNANDRVTIHLHDGNAEAEIGSVQRSDG